MAGQRRRLTQQALYNVNQTTNAVSKAGNYRSSHASTEREEIKNLYRNLKIQFNISQDENVRLRTRLQAYNIDLSRKEKEIENLTIQMQGQQSLYNS